MTLIDFFKKENITQYSILPFDEVTVTDERRASRMFKEKPCRTVVPFLIPYFTGEKEHSNLSLYAYARDYHLYIEDFSIRLSSAFGQDLKVVADTSPINEVECAVKSGLGSIGKHSLLINEEYGSFVFIGEIFSSKEMSHPIFQGLKTKDKGHFCLDCGACEKACLWGGIKDKGKCLSNINQKKKITPEEEIIIKDSKFLWGCDVCQKVCPMNKGAKKSEIPFFKEEVIHRLDSDTLFELLESGEFKKRAYAWRGEEVIKRNLELVKEEQ
ncbi:MAG: hypothetical protein E7582_03345 [Ruminococcaceae bacterium]|nr:hypothetical protein [Oscillospiraceae bacterium]